MEAGATKDWGYTSFVRINKACITDYFDQKTMRKVC